MHVFKLPLARLAALSVLACAFPVAAQAADAATAAQTARENGSTHDLDKIQCKKVEATGSRLSAKRICLTKREWEEQAREARQLTERTARPKPIGD